MKYIVYNKNDNKVIHILDKKPLALTDNLDIARCENIINAPQYGHLIVKNLETKIEEYTVEVDKLNEETGEVLTVKEVKQIEYQVCELEAVENPNKETLIAKSKERAYENRVSALIRLKYSLNSELAILRQRDTKPEEYAEYNAYAEQCKVKAKQELQI